MPGIWIKTADQSYIQAENPLRYCIYKEVKEPGTYELRGSVTDTSSIFSTYNTQNFPGFYYNLDKNMGSEEITFILENITPSGAILTDQLEFSDANGNMMRGIVYRTSAQPKKFKFELWGQYMVIAFLTDKYFAAYRDTIAEYAPAEVSGSYIGYKCSYIGYKSKNRNLMADEQISKILIDDNAELLINSSSPLKLKEGYELVLKYVNSTHAIVELKKNGQIIDTKIIQPSITNASIADRTYYYKTSIGDTKDIVTIAVHFKNAIHSPSGDLATVDGLFQISETPIIIRHDQRYGKMSIRNVNATAMTITMDNKDNPITLSRNKDIPLMNNIHIKTADQEITDEQPLRYYIYSEETLQSR